MSAAPSRKIAQGVREQREALMHLQSTTTAKPLFEAGIDVDDVIATFSTTQVLPRTWTPGKTGQVALPSDRVQRSPAPRAVWRSGADRAVEFPHGDHRLETRPRPRRRLLRGAQAVGSHALAELQLARIIADPGCPQACSTWSAARAWRSVHRWQRTVGVAKITFTGSNAVGVQVMQRAAENHRKGVSLELGGKSSLLVLADADLDLAVELACGGGFFNAGQMCSATSRVLVADTLADEFLQRLRARAEGIRVADPFAEDVEMGALINRAQYQRVVGHIQRGIKDGARLLCGGERPADLARVISSADRVYRCAVGQCVMERGNLWPGAVCQKFRN